MTSYAVIGASRGIGLEFVRQLVKRPGATVFAIVRNPSTSTYLAQAVEGLTNVHVVQGDVVDYHSLEAAAKAVSQITGGTLDCLIHNAARTTFATVFKGLDDYESMDALDADLIDAYKINALGAIHGITAFLPLLRASSVPVKKVVVLSTGGADPKTIRKAGVANMLAYQVTKCAALMITTKYALKLKDEGFIVASINPGLVDTTETSTESGIPAKKDILNKAEEGFKARGMNVKLESPESSVLSQLQVIDGLKESDNGLLLSHHGGEWHV